MIQVDFRFSNAEELEEVKNIAQRVSDTCYVEGTTCKLNLQSLRDAMELMDMNVSLLEKANEIFDRVNLPKLTTRLTGGGSDAAYTTKYGIPTLDSLGVECGNIHSKDEFASISSLKESAKRLAAICCCI